MVLQFTKRIGTSRCGKTLCPFGKIKLTTRIAANLPPYVQKNTGYLAEIDECLWTEYLAKMRVVVPTVRLWGSGGRKNNRAFR